MQYVDAALDQVLAELPGVLAAYRGDRTNERGARLGRREDD